MVCLEAAAGLVAVAPARNLPLPPFPQRCRWFRPARTIATEGAPKEDGGAGSSVAAGVVSAALTLPPVPSSLLHPAPPGCSQPLLSRQGRRDHVGLGGGGESGPPAQAGGAGGRHHWQGQCRLRRTAPLPRRRAPSPFLAFPLTLSLALLLRREQPAAGSSLSRSRCRDTWAGCSPSAPGPARDTRALLAAIRAVPGSQTL